MSMVTATTWVPRGFAAPFPTKYVFDEEEFERISKLAKLQLDDAKEELEEAREKAKEEYTGKESKDKNGSNGVNAMKTNEDIDDDLKEYDMENYDAESGQEDEGDTMGMFGNVKSLVYHERESEGGPDPYVTLPNADAEDDEEEREALQILATDNLVLAGRIEDEVAHLEVYVYEDDADNLYVHHDIMLPAIPLAVEWLDLPVGKGAEIKPDGRGSYVAVGTMDPDIELWDLDTVDCMYPNAILGEGGSSAAPSSSANKSLNKKKKKKKSRKPNDTHHVDAVLALAANRSHRNLLASASADATVKLWDLHALTCARSYASLHTDKVCALAWHPRESAVLLSGSYDRTAAAADARAPDAPPRRWRVESDVESVRWDPHDPNYFYIATEGGAVHCHDARNGTTAADAPPPKPLWTLQAHSESVSAFDVNPAIPGFLVTGSTDREVKIWNVPAGGAGGPSMVTSRDLGVGRVFSAGFAPDAEVAFRLAVAGSKGAVQVWDTSTNAAVRRTFAGRGAGVKVAEEGKAERVVGVQEEDDDDDESSGEDEEGGENGERGARAGGGGKGADGGGWESMSE